MSRNPAPSRRRKTRAGLLVAAPLMLVFLTACSEQWSRLGLPVAASEEAPTSGISGTAHGSHPCRRRAGVGPDRLGRHPFRRRKDGNTQAPADHYHLPLKMLYTLVPFLIIGVLFFFTVRRRTGCSARTRARLASDRRDRTEVVLDVQLLRGRATRPSAATRTPSARSRRSRPLPALEQAGAVQPRVGRCRPFILGPDFYFKRDVIPGHPNSSTSPPTARRLTR